MLITEAVTARCCDREAGTQSLKEAAAQGEPFYSIEPRDVGDMPRREGKVAAAGQGLCPDEGARLLLNLFYILVGDRAHVRGKRIEDASGER